MLWPGWNCSGARARILFQCSFIHSNAWSRLNTWSPFSAQAATASLGDRGPAFRMCVHVFDDPHCPGEGFQMPILLRDLWLPIKRATSVVKFLESFGRKDQIARRRGRWREGRLGGSAEGSQAVPKIRFPLSERFHPVRQTAFLADGQPKIRFPLSERFHPAVRESRKTPVFVGFYQRDGEPRLVGQHPDLAISEQPLSSTFANFRNSLCYRKLQTISPTPKFTKS